jgi:hypothetical protein
MAIKHPEALSGAAANDLHGMVAAVEGNWKGVRQLSVETVLPFQLPATTGYIAM